MKIIGSSGSSGSSRPTRVKPRGRHRCPALGPATRLYAGMTLMETLVSMMIVAIVISATINGYILSTNRADWSSQSLAAHSLALQRIEQVRAATWNISGETDVDQVTPANFPEVNSVLDLPVSGTNSVTATIRTTITTVSANPPLKMVRVDCVWPYRNRGLFTNTITTYRAAEQ